ncbi:MAG: lipopolysaccharide assembly protein LapA domain-containing protein [Snowella sp.]|nr:lipopolysaccharide assembly protein LapA domain-containing protein [Snowella sp.]
MNTITNFLASAIVGGWIMTMAVFAIQNIQPVSLKFLQFESIKVPIGVLLAFSLGIGFFIAAIIPAFLESRKNLLAVAFLPQNRS